MMPQIIENYSQCGVKVGKVVKRILKYAPPNSIEGLNEVLILDGDPQGKAFACYERNARRIILYLDEIIGWQPWLLKKSYIFPYLSIGIALGHEIDHHVNRNQNSIDKEKSAESNILKYIYPSFGIFKPLFLISNFVLKPLHRIFDSLSRHISR